MSWDATLTYGGMFQDWNYTHNCNGMIGHVVDTLRPGARDAKRAETGYGSWWDLLHGMNGEEGYKLLSQIVGGLSEAPAFFREMNPDNGWGDYDSLMRVLIEMRDASEAAPAASWSVWG